MQQARDERSGEDRAQCLVSPTDRSPYRLGKNRIRWMRARCQETAPENQAGLSTRSGNGTGLLDFCSAFGLSQRADDSRKHAADQSAEPAWSEGILPNGICLGNPLAETDGRRFLQLNSHAVAGGEPDKKDMAGSQPASVQLLRTSPHRKP